MTMVTVRRFEAPNDGLLEAAALLTDAMRHAVGTDRGLVLVRQPERLDMASVEILRVVGRVHAVDGLVLVHVEVWQDGSARWVRRWTAPNDRMAGVAEPIAAEVARALHLAGAAGKAGLPELRGLGMAHGRPVSTTTRAATAARGRADPVGRLLALLDEVELDDRVAGDPSELLGEVESAMAAGAPDAAAVLPRALLRLRGDDRLVICSPEPGLQPWKAWALASSGRATWAASLARAWTQRRAGGEAEWRAACEALWLARDYEAACHGAGISIGMGHRDPVILGIAIDAATRLGARPAGSVLSAAQRVVPGHARIRAGLIGARASLPPRERAMADAFRVVPACRLSAAHAAGIAAAVGDVDQAVALLDMAHHESAPSARTLLVDPRWDSLRRTAGFRDLLRLRAATRH